MTDHKHVSAASELVYPPKPSWAPAFFAAGIALAVTGLFSHFLLPGWFYSLLGIVFILAALRSFVSGTIHDYYRLPRHQRVRGAVLPASSIHVAKRDRG